MNDPRPFLGSYLDRHGRRRWRFRRKGRTVSLPGEPGEARFETAYSAAIEGRAKSAEVRRMPGSALPRTLRAAWRIVTTGTAEWEALRATSKAQQIAVAERFFATPIAEGVPMVWGDAPLADLQRGHIKRILAGMSDRPHAARHVLSLLRKLAVVGLDEGWITVDPTYRVKHRPAMKGWRAWTDAERAQFELRWPIGTTPRLVYTLALLTGQRRSDVARLTWADLDADGLGVGGVQLKTDHAWWVPVLPDLAAVLAATPRTGRTIVLTAYGEPYSIKSLSMRMRDWTAKAGLPAGCTLHGLRKTLGKMLAEGGASTRQMMDVLGHTSVQHTELYSRDARQRHMAAAGMRLIKGGKAAG